MLSQFQSLRVIVQPFVQICLLRQGPQDLPTSGILLAITLSAYTLLTALLSNVSMSAANAVVWGLISTVLMVAFTVILLSVQRRPARLVQTLAALAGTGALLTLIALPVFGWLHGADLKAGEGALAWLIVVVLTLWSLAVTGHILRHALSVPYFVGLVLAVVFYLISVSVFRTLFPAAA
ncbi:MAG: hypothetical protein GTO28_06375 [Gammaproteobacteria bacterium]|nr:hypothetical protein [Gammaproteobacteria bacterium]NIM72782.1 hypothetical protein [Gammaproteobacteria bacterium]NIO24530.1 hypothetical protein [Gammaproteobacteria bacterium]NIO65139.1 hypothetical protein [Gammaproteobacteria bacterium]NIP45048.1 hypothetical protein [Gammaproteobacteria bacterium]